MRYYANPSTPSVRDAMTTGLLGSIHTPRQGNTIPEGVAWCADNRCFSAKWDADAWWTWLQRLADKADACAFAVAPDVVGDALATLERAKPWLYRIRELGYPVAYVAQDGWGDVLAPWDEFDVLFLGGTTEWKLGPEARAAAAEAKARGKRRGHRLRLGRRHVPRLRPRPEPRAAHRLAHRVELPAPLGGIVTADPRPLFAEFNRGVQRARRAYQAEEKGASHDPTCRAEGCHRARDGHHTRCGTCRKAGRR